MAFHVTGGVEQDEIDGRKADAIAKAAFEAGVAAERARCIKIAEDQANYSDSADCPYDGGSGSLGYESACRDIAETIARPEKQESTTAAEIMALHDQTMAALKAMP